jgi:hypothetical protein
MTATTIKIDTSPFKNQHIHGFINQHWFDSVILCLISDTSLFSFKKAMAPKPARRPGSKKGSPMGKTAILIVALLAAGGVAGFFALTSSGKPPGGSTKAAAAKAPAASSDGFTKEILTKGDGATFPSKGKRVRWAGV